MEFIKQTVVKGGVNGKAAALSAQQQMNDIAKMMQNSQNISKDPLS